MNVELDKQLKIKNEVQGIENIDPNEEKEEVEEKEEEVVVPATEADEELKKCQEFLNEVKEPFFNEIQESENFNLDKLIKAGVMNHIPGLKFKKFK